MERKKRSARVWFSGKTQKIDDDGRLREMYVVILNTRWCKRMGGKLWDIKGEEKVKEKGKKEKKGGLTSLLPE